jgi:hypothetical protein
MVRSFVFIYPNSISLRRRYFNPDSFDLMSSGACPILFEVTRAAHTNSPIVLLAISFIRGRKRAR